jgi:flagellin
VTIGATTYTFVAAGQAVNADQVALGNNVNATLTNLMDAVNGIGSGSNTTYGAGTTQNASAIISGVSNGVATVEAASGGAAAPGAGGNSVALSVTSGAGTASVSGANLSGGAAADTVTVGSVTYTFVAAGQATAGNEIALGATAQATLDNLKAAVNSTAIANGSASTYHLANAAALQGPTGATIVSDTNGVAQVQAEVAGVLATPIGLSVSFAGGNTTGTLAGLSSGDLSGGAAATAATGHFELTANPLAGNTVTIGSESYTFVSGAPTAANQVMLGSNVQGTLNNLMEAVNNGPNGTGAGTDYGTGTVANTSATISAVNGGQATVTASTLGTTGNSIAISATLSNGAGGGVVGTNNLSGGGASVSLDSATDAQAALTVIAGAISTVASTRGAIGSSINQMNAALQVNENTAQNLTSSLSGIQDANIGQVVANMSKYQVLEQTGIAALTQANQQEQTVLKLLQ